MSKDKHDITNKGYEKKFSNSYGGFLVFHRKRLEPRVLPWQQYSRCHFVSFVMYITGVKFEDHCSNILEIFLIQYFIV